MASRNTRLQELFSGSGEALQAWLVAKPKAFYDDIRYKIDHLAETNFALGLDFMAQGKWNDAVFRFRIALYFQPDYPKANYHLGCCYIQLNKRVEARQAMLRAQALAPADPDMLLMLSALDPAAVPAHLRPQRMPEDMVMRFFASLAERYDAIETANQYQGGKVCFEALKPFIAGRTGLQLLDLGCGTGLAARPFRSIAAEVTGIDFTPAMAQVARTVQSGPAFVYDRVLQEDVLQLNHTGANLAAMDIVLCCNVAQFMGDLQPMLHCLSERLPPHALMLLTLEPFSTNAGYGVNIETGRFGHHPHYIKQLAQQCGMILHHEAKTALYPSIAAQVVILGKGTV